MVMGRALYSVGFWIRETGQALDRLGCRLQGKNHFREQRTISFHPSYFPIPIQSLFDPKFSLILMLYRSIDYAIVIDFISICAPFLFETNQSFLIYFKKIAESDSLQLFVSVLCICLPIVIDSLCPACEASSYFWNSFFVFSSIQAPHAYECFWQIP